MNTKQLLLLFLTIVFFLSGCQHVDKKEFRDNFNITDCDFSTTGSNDYFILEPFYQLELRGVEGKDTIELLITVLDETREVGGIETRIVEERESKNGELFEISRNYFAICEETGDMYYFGEEVDNYKNNEIVNHSGAWLAEGNNKAGLIMPGKCKTGDKYYQEIAPEKAMDRAEIISISEEKETPAGNFQNVLYTIETSPLEPDDKSIKRYALKIGMIQDDELLLVRYGFIN